MVCTEDHGPCGDCGHSFSAHATDSSFPNVQRCFHGAATGDGCRPKYDERCKQYAPPKK